ncbi:MAG TPA: hypothetical protein VHP33_17160 [Polyangiaceae bacterium]|nr:hypothetical protein [Polyangiaceae bacterium]
MASSSAPPEQGPVARPAPTRFQTELEHARTKRREAGALAFVSPVNVPSDARIQALAEWLRRRHTATDKAESAYGLAREQATPAEQVLLERERGELFWELFEAEVRASLAIFPGIDQAPAERVASLRTALVGRYRVDSDRARDRFLACLILSSQLGLKNADSARCEEQIRAIDALKPPEKQRDPALEEWRYARVEAAPRSRRPVTRGPDCRLSGSAATGWTRLYTAATGEDHSLVLADFDVAALELPVTRGERARVSIDHPFKASGYVDLDAGVVRTAARIELLAGHLWLDPQSIVHAFGVEGGQVSIEREGGPKSEPAVALRVACAELTLARERPSPTGEVKGETSQVYGVVPLFASPGGKQIAQLDSDSGLNVRVLARQPGWAHVTSAGAGASFSAMPYEFDAWVAERFAPVGKDGFGIAATGYPRKPATHVTTALLALRLSPDPKAAVVAELAPGVALLAGAEQGNMRRIRFNEASGNNEGNDFWVTREALSSRAKPAPSKARPR